MERVFLPKFFSVCKAGIEKKQITKDIFAGIIVGIIALPLAIAFAVASGVSPEKGIATAIIAGFIISFLGGSRVQIGGPTGAFIVIVLGIVEEFGFNGLLIATILAGFILIIFGLLKLGTLLKFIPYPMIIGFTSGIAVIIFTSQVKDAMGLNIEHLPGGFIEKWGLYFSSIKNINFYAFAVTVATILIIVFFKKITTKIPGSFVAIVVVTFAVNIFDIPVHNIKHIFGDIPTKLQFTLPEIDLHTIGKYINPALVIALLGSIESLLSAVVADGMIGGNHRSNTELIAQGIANVVTPFFGGIPATGAIARTATNIKNGGRTPIAGIVHAVTLMLILLFLGKWAKLIPMSCLAGILIVVAINMSEWRSFLSVLKGSRFDILILLTTFLLTIFVDLTVAIEVGIVLSSILFMKRMSDVSKKIPNDIDKDVLEKYDLPPEINVYEISGPFFFASAKLYSEAIRQVGFKSKLLIIRMRHVPFIDSTGCENFMSAIKDLRHQGIEIVLSGVNQDVRSELSNKGIDNLIGKSNIFSQFNDAVKFAESKIL